MPRNSSQAPNGSRIEPPACCRLRASRVCLARPHHRACDEIAMAVEVFRNAVDDHIRAQCQRLLVDGPPQRAVHHQKHFRLPGNLRNAAKSTTRTSGLVGVSV